MIALIGKHYQLAYGLSIGVGIGLLIAAAIYLSIVLLTSGWISTGLITAQIIRGKIN